MRLPTQAPIGRCECGRVYHVTATASLYEFDWRCSCGFAGVISWFHGGDPPHWTERLQQGALTGMFTEAS